MTNLQKKSIPANGNLPKLQIVSNKVGIVSPTSKSQTNINYSISIDWLDITLDMSEKTQQKIFEKNTYIPFESFGTRSFKKSFKIYHNDIIIATLYLEGNGAIDKKLAKLHVENHVLYHQEAQDIIYTIIEEYELKNPRISRIDVALDMKESNFEYFIHNYKTLEQLSNDILLGNIRINERLQYSIHKQGNKINGLSVGKNPKRLSIYNKTRQLNTLQKKKIYIEEIHTRLSGKGEVIRFEAQYSKCGKTNLIEYDDLGTLEKIDIFKIFDETTLLDLVANMVKDRLDIRYNDNDRFSRCTKIIPIKPKRILLDITKVDNTKAKKLIINGLLKDQSTLINNSDRETMINTAYKIADRYNILLYFYKKLAEQNIEGLKIIKKKTTEQQKNIDLINNTLQFRYTKK